MTKAMALLVVGCWLKTKVYGWTVYGLRNQETVSGFPGSGFRRSEPRSRGFDWLGSNSIDIMISSISRSMESPMAQFVVRNLDDDLKARLKRRARLNGVSMEEEVRQILQRAVVGEPPGSPAMGSRMAARFSGIGLDEPLPELHGQEVRGMDLES